LVGLHFRSPPAGFDVITGGVVSVVQVYTTVLGVDGLPQLSFAVIVKVRVVLQPVVESECETVIVGLPVQSSVAITPALTLSSVGGLAGLQPRSPPVGVLAMVGAVVSTVQV
jgi:hypothetical protein